ncbi:T0197986 isoform 9 [Pan troglodytes]|nr:T0197986 isoform 9 [Pan troglodytes]
MAAAEHRHSSGLPYRPYLTAETLKNRMGRQPPPPTQQRSIIHSTEPQDTSQCLLHPLPPSAPPSVDDNLNPPECVSIPSTSAPPSVDDNLNTPPECVLYPPPPSADDNLKTTPECLITPFHPQRMIISRN